MRSYLHVFALACAVMLSACGGNNPSPTTPTPPVDPTLLRITTTSLPAGSQFASYTARLESTGGQQPHRWTVDGLPSGFTVSTDGTLTGMFANPGNWMLSAKVTDAANATDTKSLQLTGGYEAVPMEKHYLLLPNGVASRYMWYRLLAEPRPARGSVITIGPGACPAGCFQNLSVEYGMDTVPNPNKMTGWNIGFSQDGVTITTRLTGGGTLPGNSLQTDTGMIWAFTEKPKYIVLQGSFNEDRGGPYGSFPGESGIGAILLDYK